MMRIIQGEELRRDHAIQLETSRTQVVCGPKYLDEYDPELISRHSDLFINGRHLLPLSCGFVPLWLPPGWNASYIEFEEELASCKPSTLLALHERNPSLLNKVLADSENYLYMSLDMKWIRALLDGRCPDTVVDTETTQMLLQAYAVLEERYILWTNEQLVGALSSKEPVELSAKTIHWNVGKLPPAVTWFVRKCELYKEDSIVVVDSDGTRYTRQKEGGKTRSYTLVVV